MVTLSHFHLRTQEALASCGAQIFAFAPLLRSFSLKTEWELYANDHQDWVGESFRDSGIEVTDYGLVPETIYPVDGHKSESSYAPLWQMEPPPQDSSILLQDMLSLPWFRRLALDAAENSDATISSIENVSFLKKGSEENATPHSIIMDPVYGNFHNDDEHVINQDEITGYVLADVPWENYFSDILPEGIKAFIIVIRNTCDAEFSFKISGHEAEFLGLGDFHDDKFDDLVLTYDFSGFRHNSSHETVEESNHCFYDFSIYPTDEMRMNYETYMPFLFAGIVLMVFLSTTLVFFMYDCSVQRRQAKLTATAKRTKAIVSSLFPKSVQERILQDAKQQADEDIKNNKKSFFTPKHMLKEFAGAQEEDALEAPSSAPIADLFPEATIMFADLVGFTAWSSTRQPSEVFTLLETIYHEFDTIANRRRVFKVETVGDCYVAVAGL